MRIFLLVIAALCSALASAAEAPRYQEGKHYEVITPAVRTGQPDKIVVHEIFWYGCGHCYNFEPLVMAWTPKLAEDVVAVRSPAMWDARMETHARIYYTARALVKDETKFDELHMGIYRAMHERRQPLTSESQIAKLFAEHGVEEETFKKTFNSFGVKSQVQQADARQRGFGISATPMLVVDGRYRISGRNLSGGQPEMLRVAEFLIDKIRQEKP